MQRRKARRRWTDANDGLLFHSELYETEERRVGARTYFGGGLFRGVAVTYPETRFPRELREKSEEMKESIMNKADAATLRENSGKIVRARTILVLLLNRVSAIRDQPTLELREERRDSIYRKKFIHPIQSFRRGKPFMATSTRS